MSLRVVDRTGIPLLGRDERAEELVEWSKRMPAGRRWVRDLPFGLRLGFVASGEEPKMYVHWNQQRFWFFLDSLGTPERFFITSYGICAEHHQGRTRVTLLGAGRTGKVLWDTLANPFSRQHGFRDREDDVNWLVGMVRFSQEGPLFLEQAECQQELEEATAIAIVRGKEHSSYPTKRKTAGQTLPKPVALSQKGRDFLLQDALINVVLQAQQSDTAR